MKKSTYFLLAFSFLIVTLSSCDWASDTTKKTVNKAGEIVGKAGSEFGDGVYQGVKKTFENDVKISDDLKVKGLEFGEVVINSTDSTDNNVLTAYVIFNDQLDQEIMIKVFNENGKEYGRLKEKLKGEKGDATHIEFIFDKRVNIGVKGTVSIEEVQ